MIRPTHLNRENADAFLEEEVARLYEHRPAYPRDAIRFLASLAVDEPRRVLDLGCGTGFIARPIADLVDHVDAVDPSAAMIAVGRAQPGGSRSNIRWINGRAEDVELDGSYSLITTGESLHWMDWEVVLPRYASLLSPHGYLAICGVDAAATEWHAELREIIANYSVVRDYEPYDMIAALERAGLFRIVDRYQSAIESFEQSLPEYIDSFHARSSLTRSRMGDASAAAFDREVTALVRKYTGGTVVRMVSATVTYGVPADGGSGD